MQENQPKTPEQNLLEYSLIHWPFPTYKGDCILKQKKALTRVAKQETKEAINAINESIALF